jgi:hypothetical protein
MGLLDILGGITNLLPGVGQAAKDIRQAITGEIDPTTKATIASKAQELEAALSTAQMELDKAILTAQAQINLAEANSSDKFKSWWRPAIGWVCAVGLLYLLLGEPILKTIGVSVPGVDTNLLLAILIPMLGLGGLRTLEKIQK